MAQQQRLSPESDKHQSRAVFLVRYSAYHIFSVFRIQVPYRIPEYTITQCFGFKNWMEKKHGHSCHHTHHHYFNIVDLSRYFHQLKIQLRKETKRNCWRATAKRKSPSKSISYCVDGWWQCVGCFKQTNRNSFIIIIYSRNTEKKTIKNINFQYKFRT